MKSMKKWLGIALLCVVFVFTQAAAPGSEAARKDSPIQLLVNGKAPVITADPIMKEGTVYVPFRGLLNALGAKVDADAKTGVVTAEFNGIVLQLKTGDSKASVNGKSVKLKHPPLLIDGTTYVSVRWLNETFGAVVKWQSRTKTVAVYYPQEELPSVGSYEHLQTLLSDAMERQSRVYRGTMKVTLTSESFAVDDQSGAAADGAPATASKSAEAASDSAAASGSDYSTTNVQVEGVDEADVVKTDGTYIYQVNRQRIIITSAVPADQMKTVASLRYGDGTFMPQEIYVDSKRLIVIGSNAVLTDTAPAQPLMEKKREIMPIRPMLYTTKALVYDIADKSAPKLIRELELEGNYVSSRKIGSSLYLISNKYFDYAYIMNEQSNSPAIAAPMVRDSMTGSKLASVAYDDIRYFPEFVEPNYMLIGAVDLAAEEQPMNVSTFLGSGQNVYASADNLYITISRYTAPAPETDPSLNAKKIAPDYGSISTAIYKFALQPGSVTYMAEGNVPGTIINQFSMDEFNGHFRIATTTDGGWGMNGEPSKNNLYVLGDALQQVGKIENIAPGERIYSVRFSGKRAFMVTFRTVDPLFVIDVADPAAPKILGALKIPGYSDYLHPYDENHLIGFGKDTAEVDIKDENGRTVGTNAFYLGMKVALFDVTDVEHPKELHKVIIGDRGTGSELLYNHKALLFSKEKNLLAFPVDLYELPSGASSKDAQRPDYGMFTYQGAYVYKLDPASGFQLQGRITHMSEEELEKAGNYGYGDKMVRRILYIGDTLYTLSDGMLKANAISDLKEVGSLNIPVQ